MTSLQTTTDAALRALEEELLVGLAPQKATSNSFTLLSPRISPRPERGNPQIRLNFQVKDEDGNVLIIPLLAAHSSDLWSPRKRFIITDNLKKTSVLLSSRSSPLTMTTPRPFDGAMDLNEQNPFMRDPHVTMNEAQHKYSIYGQSDGIISMTEVIENIAFPDSFSPERVISSIVNSDDYKNDKSPYSGLTVAEIREKWEKNRQEAADHGTRVHKAVETFFIHESLGASTLTIPYLPNALHAFRRRYPHFKAIRTEHRIFDEMLLIGGTVDLLGVFEKMVPTTPDRSFPDDRARMAQDANLPAALRGLQPHKKVIIDIKTYGEVPDAFETFQLNEDDLKYPSRNHPSVRHMKNTNFAHAIVQLNGYRDIYRRRYNLVIDEMYILVIPNRDLRSTEHHLIPVPFLDMEPIWDTRDKNLRALFKY